MKTTRAYLAGFGAAGALLAAVAVAFALVSALVVFDGWPRGLLSAESDTVDLGDRTAARTARSAEGSRPTPATPSSAVARPRAGSRAARRSRGGEDRLPDGRDSTTLDTSSTSRDPDDGLDGGEVPETEPSVLDRIGKASESAEAVLAPLEPALPKPVGDGALSETVGKTPDPGATSSQAVTGSTGAAELLP